MAEFEIKRAERSQAKLRLGLAGVSGGGKTWTSLLLAKGLVQAMLDAKRAKLEFDRLERDARDTRLLAKRMEAEEKSRRKGQTVLPIGNAA